MLKTFIAQTGQNIYDVALMTYGTLDKIVQLVQDSDLDSLNNEAVALKEFPFDTDEVSDQSFYNKTATTTNVIGTDRAADTGASFDDSFDFSFDI